MNPKLQRRGSGAVLRKLLYKRTRSHSHRGPTSTSNHNITRERWLVMKIVKKIDDGLHVHSATYHGFWMILSLPSLRYHILPCLLSGSLTYYIPSFLCFCSDKWYISCHSGCSWTLQRIKTDLTRTVLRSCNVRCQPACRRFRCEDRAALGTRAQVRHEHNQDKTKS